MEKKKALKSRLHHKNLLREFLLLKKQRNKQEGDEHDRYGEAEDVARNKENFI